MRDVSFLLAASSWWDAWGVPFLEAILGISFLLIVIYFSVTHDVLSFFWFVPQIPETKSSLFHVKAVGVATVAFAPLLCALYRYSATYYECGKPMFKYVQCSAVL